MESWLKPSVIEVPSFWNELGNLGVIEGVDTFPFPIKRVYFLHSVPEGAVRGSHAHKDLHQLIIAVSGSFSVTLDDGKTATTYELLDAEHGLTVPPGYWRTLTNFTPGATAVVIASEEYTPSDYIRDYDEFVQWAQR